MNDYLEDIVQRIVTKCDLTDFNILKGELDGLEKKANRVSKAFSSSLTGEQQVQLAQEASARAWNNAQIAKSNEIISWNNALRAKSNEAISWNNAQKAQENRLTAESNNQRKIEMQDTDKQLAQLRIKQSEQAGLNAQTRKDIQLSKERTAGIKEQTVAMQRSGRVLRYFGRMFMAYFGIRTIQNIVNTGARIQMLQRSIQGLTGSGQDWEFINQQAYKYGVSLTTVATGYRNFYSSAKMAGFSADQIQSMYGDLLLSTRAIGASSEQTGGALLALEQMISKGTVSMEELRRQLGNSIPGAFEIGAKAMNMTTQQFNEFVKKGELASKDFVPKFIKTLRDQYANGWKDVEQTVAVAQGRLLVAWQNFTEQLMHGDVGKGLARGINAIARILMSKDFQNAIQLVSNVLGKIIHYGGIIYRWVKRIYQDLRRFFTFIARHLSEILFLLGSAGIVGILNTLPFTIAKITQALGVLWAALGALTLDQIVIWIGAIETGIGFIAAALWRVVVPILIIQDFLMFVSNVTRGTHFKTVFGLGFEKLGQSKLGKILEKIVDSADKINEQYENLTGMHAPTAETGIQVNPWAFFPKAIKYGSQGSFDGRVEGRPAAKTGMQGDFIRDPSAPKFRNDNLLPLVPQIDTSDIKLPLTSSINNAPVYVQPTMPQIIPNQISYATGGTSYGDISREQQIANNVTIGDINVYSNASNPAQVAEEVNNQLVALFLGQGLTMGLEGVTA